MKELNPENWIYWFGLVTVICMLLPVAAILIRQKFSTGFIALAIYFIFTFLYNLLLICFPSFPKQWREIIGVFDNFVDAPLMLLFLKNFASSQNMKKAINFFLIAHVAFAVTIIIIFGLTVKAISIFAGPGLLIILCFSFLFFTQFVRNTISQKSGYAKTIMVSGVLFAYAVYFMVYLFYYVLKTPHTSDALIIYFLATMIGAILLASGLFTDGMANKKATPYPRVALRKIDFI